MPWKLGNKTYDNVKDSNGRIHQVQISDGNESKSRQHSYDIVNPATGEKKTIYSNSNNFNDVSKSAGLSGWNLTGSLSYGVSGEEESPYVSSETQYGKDRQDALDRLLAAKSGGGVPSDDKDPYYPDYPYLNAPEYPTVASYASPYSSMIDELLKSILNNGEFKYDYTTDPTYQQYAKAYQREGDRATQNAIADAAAMTGGLPSSYAVTAGTQAGDYYADKLSDKIPELQQLAYGMWQDDLNQQVTNLGLLNDMDNTQYGRYRDDVNDILNKYNADYGAYRYSVGDSQWQQNFDYNASQDAISNDQRERDFMYKAGQDANNDTQAEIDDAYDRAMAMIKLGIMPSSDLLTTAQISTSDAQSIINSINGTGGGSTAARYGSGSDSKNDETEDDYGTPSLSTVNGLVGAMMMPEIIRNELQKRADNTSSGAIKTLKSSVNAFIHKGDYNGAITAVEAYYNKGAITDKEAESILSEFGLD